MKLSPAQAKALDLITNWGTMLANGVLACRNRVTFATLLSLERKGLVVSKLVNGA